MSKFKNLKSNKAITLIALIITVIVMLILVGVSVSILVDSDLIGTAEQTVAKWNEVADKEKEDLNSLSNRIEDMLKDQCEHEYGAWETTKQATCTEEGTEKRTCSLCSKVETQNFSATGHSYTETGRVDSTCTTAGNVTYTCSGCSDTYSENLELLEHTVVTDAAVSATCTEAGLTEGSHCSVCHTVITAQQTIPATGHQNTTIINASASYTGDTYCNDCNTTIATGEDITVTITLTGDGDNAQCYVTINGVKYTSPATLEVSGGTKISCYTDGHLCPCEKEEGGSSISVKNTAGSSIYVDNGEGEKTYEYTASGDVLINLWYSSGDCGGHGGDSRNTYQNAHIYITEQ